MLDRTGIALKLALPSLAMSGADQEVTTGDHLELEVGAAASGGGCVARAADGRVVFVRHSLPGERVRALVTATARSYLRADAVDVLEASPDRVEPPCPYAGPGRCGGCDYQHVELGAQRRLKGVRVGEQLEHIGGIKSEVQVEPVEGDIEGLAWRTRVRVAIDRQGAVGFRRHRSHDLETVDHCPVATPPVAGTGALARRWHGVSELEVVTGASAEGDESLIRVMPRGRVTPRFPGVDESTGLVVRGRVHRPPGAVHVTVRGWKFRISAGVFWQVHRGAASALLDAVLRACEARRGDAVADLYAGAGLFSVPLAAAVGPRGSVTAVERDRVACADARHNGGDQPALVVRQAAVTPGLVSDGLGTPALVVLDPARQGAGTDVMAALADHHGATLRRLVYVSCDPASFARDARVLIDRGWRLPELRAFDIFPMTEHVELVAAFDPPG